MDVETMIDELKELGKKVQEHHDALQGVPGPKQSS